MPSIDKLLPRSLNQDDDERLVTRTEMTDAQNIRVSIDADQDALVLKNSWGNTQRSSTIENGSMPAGNNACIGAVGDDSSAQVYYFVWNSAQNHTIFRYDQNAKKTYIVYQDRVLNFSKEGFVYASIVRISNGDILLYFNDSVNEPKKINATLAEQSISGAGGYPSTFSNGTIQQRTNYITVAKQPPLSPPTITFSRNNDYPQNDIFEKNFQFAYQYEYFDGEQSALSPYSELSVSISQLKDGFINQGARNFYNQINIKINNSELDVKDINIYGRVGDKDASFFLIDSIPNVHGSGTQTIPFRNDSNYTGLSASVQDKLYDNVPQKADSQAVSQGRLFYGGYTENYDNITPDVTAVPNYYNKPDTFEVVVTKYDLFPIQNQIKVDFSNLPAGGTTVDSKILLSFSWNDGPIIIKNPQGDKDDYNFTGSSPNIRVYANKSGGAPKSTTFPEELKALAGIRYKNNGSTNEAAINLEGGFLNSPPTIRFTAQKGTSDSTTKSVAIRKIKGGIKVISSGLQVRKIIDIPAGTSITSIKNIVRNQIEGLYPIQFTPQNGELGFSNLLTGGQTTATESAAFKGQGNAIISRVQVGSDFDYYSISINKVTFKVDKLVFGTREAELLNPDDTVAQFDIMENEINGFNNNIAFVGRVQTLDGDWVQINDKQNQRSPIIDRVNSFVAQGGSFMIANGDMDGNRCFKSGSTHQFGLIYYDDKGRPSGVQPIDQEVFVQHTNNRSDQNDLDGRADVVLRIKHLAPTWAERYSVMYAGQGSIINKVQYSIGGAYVALSDDVAGSFGASKNIYLSLGTLQSRGNSYDNQLGALINYGFAEGDRIRIVRYGDDQKETATWKVAKMVTLVNDVSTNPLLDRSSKAAIQNTTGDFLVIEDNNTAYFNTNSIMRGISRWNEKCVIEIYRPSGAFEETFYYEIGANLSVDSNHVHETQRPGTTLAARISSQTGNTVVAESTIKVYKGDIIAVGGKSITVGNVISNDDDDYPFLFYGDTQNTWTPTNIYPLTVTNPDSMVQIDQGDSYFRLRTLFYANAPTKGDVWRNISAAYSQNAIVDFIEDPRVSDFFVSGYTSLGKRYAYLPENRRIKRYGSITYSEPFNIDNTTLGLSSFNLTTLNFKDLSYDYGSIKSLVPYDEFLYIVHERRGGIVPVKRNILTANDGESLTATDMVLGPVKYYVGEYGCNNNPESVAWYRGYVFFVDAKAGKVLRMNFQTGMDVISEQQVDSFFKEKMFSNSTSAKNRLYRAGVDRENYEYIISSPALNTSELTITDSCSGEAATGFSRTDEDGEIINVSAVYDNSLTFNFNSDSRQWECAEDDWDDSGKGLLLIDQLTNNPIVGLAEDQSPTITGILQSIPILMTSSAYQAYHTAVYSQLTEEVTPDANGQSTFTITNTSETLSKFTIAYDVRSNYWSTRYSYTAEEIVGLSDRLYTFSEGHIYEHEPDATRNTFYGVAGDSIVECISNFNPSMVKAYEALSLEGNNKDWSVTLNNSDQTSTIATSIWQEKEGFYYAPIHQDSTNNIDYTATANVSSISGTSEVFGVGTVASITGSDAFITFKNAINNIGFPVGVTTALFKVSGTNLVPLNLYAVSISGDKKLECNGTVSGLVADDEIVLIGNSAIEGDVIRDYYLKAKFVNSTTTAHELYAINFIYTKSNLHNQRGQ